MCETRGLYTFDMRKLSAATGRHWDHVMAVLDVDYAPNGLLAKLVGRTHPCRTHRGRAITHDRGTVWSLTTVIPFKQLIKDFID